MRHEPCPPTHAPASACCCDAAAVLTAAQRASHIKRRKQVWEALHPQVRANQLTFKKEVGSDSANTPVSNGSIQDADSSGASCATTQSRTSSRGRVGEGRPQEFAAETAAITGESKSQINRQLAVANALGDDLQRVEGTSLDKGVELTALSKMAEPERRALIDKAQAGESVSARTQPTPLPGLAMQLAGVINRAAGLMGLEPTSTGNE